MEVYGRCGGRKGSSYWPELISPSWFPNKWAPHSPSLKMDGALTTNLRQRQLSVSKSIVSKCQAAKCAIKKRLKRAKKKLPATQKPPALKNLIYISIYSSLFIFCHFSHISIYKTPGRLSLSSSRSKSWRSTQISPDKNAPDIQHGSVRSLCTFNFNSIKLTFDIHKQA